MKKTVAPHGYSQLIGDLSSLIERGRRFAVRYVNTALVVTYWLMGRRIVEYEQKGKKRAEYGETTLRKLADDLTNKFGRGFSLPQLKNIRQFYLLYSKKSYTLSSQSGSIIPEKFLVRFPLSWSHYCELMRLDDPAQREFYERECIQGNWSVRQLDRQIQSLLYERIAHSRRKAAVIAKAHTGPIVVRPEDEIKDPYVLEFLGLKDEYSESQLEEALIHHLEEFLLELGTGFTFVARQKRITIMKTIPLGSFFVRTKSRQSLNTLSVA